MKNNSLIMVKRFIICLLAVLLGVMPLWAKQKIVSNGIPLKPFKTIMLIGNKHTSVVFANDEQYKMDVIGCPDNAVQFNESDNILFVSTLGMDSLQSVQVRIGAPVFQDIECSFMETLRSIDTLSTKNLTLTAVSSNVDLALSADTFSLNFIGGNSAILTGICKEANINSQGFAEGNRYTFDAGKLTVQNMHLNCGVLSDMQINISDSLWLTDGIDCKIEILGLPMILQNNLYKSEIHLQSNN